MDTKPAITQVKVWDPLVRIFHWSLVLAFATSYLTGDEWDDWGDVHEISGYLILGLVVVRIIWGFVGSKYARFSDFMYAPKAVIEYLKSLLTTHPKHYLGHNPAGGWMVAALLACLLATTVTGLKVLADEHQEGPLAKVELALPSLIAVAEARKIGGEQAENEAGEGDENESIWKEIHEFFSNFTLFLVIAHILGVIVSSRLHKENLARAMVTGNKTIHNKTDV
ncbi:cytochrome b/b6 domain-containing protein [uncultured Thiothrix sp.]|jgi:cytochrome b|uniref:cytochrome b/b6 domain-containing protein n=1 Tax=uncultured Thiothrix sp. TaxID=223185 RepID=UPI0026089CCE|nr:cytochrome b/b6 domain-containing protein [uncultured Thiothrix sp.]HMT91962.1 cytochrome b/b6 domain-containing protein [Thiolinea sp.]